MKEIIGFILSGLFGLVLYFLFERFGLYLSWKQKIRNFILKLPRWALYILFILLFSLVLFFVAISNVEWKQNGFSIYVFLGFSISFFFIFLVYIILEVDKK